MTFANPWILALLPLTLVPWLVHVYSDATVDAIQLLPGDPTAKWIDRIFKLIASVIIALILFILAFPHIPETERTKSGEGAHTVILLDRSRSMDEPFRDANDRTNRPNLVRNDPNSKSKSQVSKEILGKFVGKRDEDRFGMTVFSTKPIRTLPITNKPNVIQAAINAGSIGRGLAETNIGSALVGALSVYKGEPYTGSRNILLISDGGDALNTPVKAKIKGLLRKHRVSLFWIYIRSHNAEPIDTRDSFSPHIVLNLFFESLSTPYKLYTAENPNDLERAIEEISKIRSQPILYTEVVPRREMTAHLYRALFTFLILLVGFYLATQPRRSLTLT
ncbi:MAG: VWA domain-containing protein [Acidiferrobacterales bacterium]|nr:VWA domain-containing protein [Acidiferrobacterales bacterium]